MTSPLPPTTLEGRLHLTPRLGPCTISSPPRLKEIFLAARPLPTTGHIRLLRLLAPGGAFPTILPTPLRRRTRPLTGQPLRESTAPLRPTRTRITDTLTTGSTRGRPRRSRSPTRRTNGSRRGRP